MPDAQKSLREAAKPYMRRLERLGVTLLGRRWESAQDLWQLQLDLLELQRDLQDAIQKEKTRVRRERAGRVSLEALRQAMWHARRFGDAVAWLFVGLDRTALYSLASNQRVGVPPRDHSSQGMLAVAQAMSAHDLGFPILHDITDMLRVGDFTLIKPGSSRRVVEVKTDVLSETSKEGGGMEVTYDVLALWTEGELPPPGSQSIKDVLPDPPRPLDDRFTRQLRRMTQAHVWQVARPGEVVEFDGQRVLSSPTHFEQWPSRWKILRRVVRQARTSGYASAPVDGAFLYVALYDPDGLDDKDRVEELTKRLPEDLSDSGIFFADRSRNSLMFNAIPHVESGGPQMFLPYFLLPLPRRAILDMLHNRLMLMNMLNLGRVAEALEKEGFTVTVAENERDFRRDPIVATHSFETDSGARYSIQAHNLRIPLDEMVMEFLGLEYLSRVAQAMREATRVAAQHQEQGSQ